MTMTNNNNYDAYSTFDDFSIGGSSSGSNDLASLLFPMSFASVTANNGTVGPSKGELVLARISSLADYASFVATGIYLLYVLARTLYSVPWAACPPVRKLKNVIMPKKSKAAAAAAPHATWSDFYVRSQSECYLLSRPVGRIILCLIFTEFLTTMPSMINKYYVNKDIKAPQSFCGYQGFSIQFFGLATHFWCLVIGIWMFWILVLQNRSNLRNLEMLSHIFVWGVSAVLVTIPIGMGLFGGAGGYCWIHGGTKQGIALRFGVFYIPLWLSLFTVIILYIITIIHMLRVQTRSLRNSTRQKKMKHISTSMKLYIKLLGLPMIYVICWTFPSIRRIAEIKVKNIPVWLKFMHGISSSPHGFYNTLLFFASELIGSFFDRRARMRSEHQICDVHLQESTVDYIRWMEEGNETEDENLEADVQSQTEQPLEL